jgi:hypothetical protein
MNYFLSSTVNRFSEKWLQSIRKRTATGERNVAGLPAHVIWMIHHNHETKKGLLSRQRSNKVGLVFERRQMTASTNEARSTQMTLDGSKPCCG